MSKTMVMTTVSCGTTFSDDHCCGCLNVLELEDGKWLAYCNECDRMHGQGISETISDEEAVKVENAVRTDHLFVVALAGEDE